MGGVNVINCEVLKRDVFTCMRTTFLKFGGPLKKKGGGGHPPRHPLDPPQSSATLDPLIRQGDTVIA